MKNVHSLFDMCFWATAAIMVAFALASFSYGQEYSPESYEQRLQREFQRVVDELDGRVTTVEDKVQSLENRVAGLEQNNPNHTGPGQSAPTSPVPATLSAVKINEADLPWEAKPTPRDEVVRILEMLKPQAGETFVDYGCGFDARYLIEAARRYGCKGIGIEIDPARAASARQYVAEAGLADRIQIIEGDARTVDVTADVGVVYVDQQMLAAMRPRLERLNRFVSYQHAVPGLVMTKGRDTYHWRRPRVENVALASATAIWQGQAYARPLCTSPTCAMCNSIRSQLASAVTVQPAKPQPTVTYQRTYTANCIGCRTCSNGRCFRPVRGFVRSVIR